MSGGTVAPKSTAPREQESAARKSVGKAKFVKVGDRHIWALRSRALIGTDRAQLAILERDEIIDGNPEAGQFRHEVSLPVDRCPCVSQRP